MVAFTSLGSLSHLHRSLFNNGLEMGYFLLLPLHLGLSPPPPPPHSTPSTPAAAQTLGGNITTWKTLLTSTYSIPPSFQSRGQESLLSSLPRIDRPPARAGGQGTDLGQLYHSPALLPQESSLISPGFISSVLMQEYNKFFMWFLKCLKYVKNTDPPNTVVTSHMCLLSPESMVNPSGDEW